MDHVPALVATLQTTRLRVSTVHADHADHADLAIVVAAGEPSRTLVDDHLRAGRPHLVVGAGPRGYRVGPFVVPGSTACLRCVDAHLAVRDPRRGVVVEQLAGRTAAPDDTVLEQLAVTWAVRDALRYLAGERPSTWSATGSKRSSTPRLSISRFWTPRPVWCSSRT